MRTLLVFINCWPSLIKLLPVLVSLYGPAGTSTEFLELVVLFLRALEDSLAGTAAIASSLPTCSAFISSPLIAGLIKEPYKRIKSSAAKSKVSEIGPSGLSYIFFNALYPGIKPRVVAISSSFVGRLTEIKGLDGSYCFNSAILSS